MYVGVVKCLPREEADYSYHGRERWNNANEKEYVGISIQGMEKENKKS